MRVEPRVSQRGSSKPTMIAQKRFSIQLKTRATTTTIWRNEKEKFYTVRVV